MIGAPDGCSSTETLIRTDDCRTHAKNLVIGSKASHLWHNHQGGPGAVVPKVQKTAKLLIVEGNIGVGKTTLARKLASEMGYKLYLEPTVENPFLEKFYANPKKYALKLQLWILKQRYLTYSAAVKHILATGEGVILDRSVYSDCVFANVCRKEGYITSDGYQQYQYWRQKALEHLPLPHVTLFLDAPPQCCYDRIHQRGRKCESEVPLNYLTKLHAEYLKFIEDIRVQGSCVLHYDWSSFQDEKKILAATEEAEVPQWHLVALPHSDGGSIPSDNNSLEVLLAEDKGIEAN